LKALLLAAGRGQRLGSLTDSCPKPLLPVGKDTTLGLWLNELCRYDFEEVLVNAHYLADQVEAFVLGHSCSSRTRVKREARLLGTAGSIKSLLSDSWSEGVVVVHADNYFVGTIAPLIESFLARPTGIEICMNTFICGEPSEVGVVEVDSCGVVRQIWEKDPNAPSQVANAAIFVISPSVVQSIGEEIDFSAEVLPKYLGRILAVPLVGTLIDIGTPERLERARRLAQEQEFK